MDLEARQQDGLRVLQELAETQARARLEAGNGRTHISNGDLHNDSDDTNTDAISARQGRHAALTPEYHIPVVSYTPHRWLMVFPILTVTACALWLHRHNGTWYWMIPLMFVLIQFVLSWRQIPIPCKEGAVDDLFVTVNIPCYNEDPAILDRTIYALMVQTRLPQRVEVVDDGSTVDYTLIREHWAAHSPPGVEFSWVRQQNGGKKHAQCATFAHDEKADIFVNIDSDSALEHRALEEGLKPFADPGVTSVAGLETAFNLKHNFLTRMQGMRVLVFQLFAMSAQSVAGGATLINPGAFSLYRAWLIREGIEAYLGETWFGTPVRLGDDTMLTLFSLCAGKAVHQPSAVAMNVYPETLSHHIRQWVRWSRASTIRTMWRLRYLPFSNYSFWFSMYQLWAYFTSVAVSLYILINLPYSLHLVVAGGLALLLWPAAVALRLVTLRRSDFRLWDTVYSASLLPIAAVWYTLVLRQIRIYAAYTCHKQGWVTREDVEVTT